MQSKTVWSIQSNLAKFKSDEHEWCIFKSTNTSSFVAEDVHGVYEVSCCEHHDSCVKWANIKANAL